MMRFVRWTVIIWIVCAIAAMQGQCGAVEIIAHRGASYDAPENTMASLRLGYVQDADAGELDIYMSRDGRIVVSHDASTARTSGVTNVIAQTDYAKLKELEVGKWGKWKTGAFSEKLPLLEQVLNIVPKGRRLFVEIKCGPEVLPALEQVLNDSGKQKQVVLIGFGYDTMVAAKQRFPKIPCYWLAGANKDKTYPELDGLIAKAKEGRLDGLNLEQGFPIDAALVKKVHKAKLKLYTWTVDNPAVAKRLAEAGVDGITTNRPEWLREQMRN